MDDRIERALIAAARRYAPPLAPPGWTKPGDFRGSLPDLAGSLSGYGVLVLALQTPPGQSTLAAPIWVDALQTLYTSLTAALFPSSTTIQAFYADGEEPPIVLLHGASIPAMIALARYVLPYTAARFGAHPSDSECSALLDAALGWLEASDLARTDYLRLRTELLTEFHPLLDGGVRPRALATAAPDAPIPARSRPAPPSLPEARPASATPPPATLPEAAPAAQAPIATPPRPPLPVVFEPPAKPARRRPPLPSLPE